MIFLIKEYELTYDNYKYTFQHNLDVLKFFVTIISIFFIGFLVKPELTSDLLSNQLMVVLILVLLISLGLIVTIAQIGIFKRRRQCVHRMNYLRHEICKSEGILEIHNRYSNISGFTEMINNQHSKFGISSWLPLIFSIVITLSLLCLLIFRTII